MNINKRTLLIPFNCSMFLKEFTTGFMKIVIKFDKNCKRVETFLTRGTSYLNENNFPLSNPVYSTRSFTLQVFHL